MHLSTALGRSEAESAALLNAFVRDVHQTVRTHGKAIYPGLGSFHLGPTGALEFHPDASLALVVNHRFAGLTPVPVQAPVATSPAAPAGPVATAPAGWMPPTASLIPPSDGGMSRSFDAVAPLPFSPLATTPPPAAGPSGGFEAPAPTTGGYPTPPYTPPPAATYGTPASTPFVPATAFTNPILPPPEDPAPARSAASRRALVTLVLLALLGLLAWYLWTKTSSKRNLPTAETATPATVVAPSTPNFALPPPDSLPPDSLPPDSVPSPSSLAADSAALAPSAVDPGASAADPAPAASTAPSASSAPSTAPRSTPTVRPSPSPYTPYTGSSRPDRTVRRSPPRRPHTGRTYTSPSSTPRRTTTTAPPDARPTTPTPVTTAPAVRPTTRPAPAPEPTYETGLTSELETMLLSEERVQPGIGWTIVVRGEPTESEAQTVAERYRAVGYRVNVFQGLTADGRAIFRVVVGQFPTVRDAQRALRTLAGDAFPADAWMLPLAADE